MEKVCDNLITSQYKFPLREYDIITNSNINSQDEYRKEHIKKEIFYKISKELLNNYPVYE